MNTRRSNWSTWCAVGLVLVLGVANASAGPKITFQPDAEEQIRLEVGQTRLIRSSTKVIRISVADPSVADVQVVTPRQVLVTAKAVGYTHLILWGEDDIPVVVAISCTKNLDELRTQLKELFPGEEVEVSSAGDLLVLSGKVSDLRVPARVAEVAQLYTEQLANLVEVTGDQQVQLEVRFAEVSRAGLRKMGMSFLWRDPTHVGGQVPPGAYPGQYLQTEELWVPGTINQGYGAPPVVPAPNAGSVFNLFFSTGISQFPFSTILSVLSQNGLAKVLAEPTLAAMSGHEAEFHAGGEVPLLISQQLGAVTVKYKKFGVILKFVPTVLGKRTISLKLAVEVSEPDISGGVNVQGIQVPSFKSRSSETTIRIKDGQSFAVAGMLSDKTRSTIDKVPLLGDLPILGALFRSTAFQREETELLVVVTARLVKPLKPNEVPMLPGEDEITDPSDFDLFLMGRIEPEKKKVARRNPERPNPAQPKPSEPTDGPAGPIGFERQ